MPLFDVLSNPYIQFGLGTLARNDGRWNPAGAVMGAAGDVASMQTAQAMAQKKKREEEWMRSQGMANMPDWAAKAQWESQNAAPKQTNLMQNLIAAGYQPGTPEFQKAIMEQLAKDNATKVQVSLGKANESIGSQIGPILKDSRLQAEGALRMFDAANRVEEAINSGQINVGPGATVRQYLGQLASMGGADNKRVVNTRVVIQALADTAVEARKRLAGQGHVTENEAKAVEKASAGQYEELTVGELQMLADLNRRAAKLAAEQHSYYLQNMPQDAAGLRPFYEIKGLDRVMGWNPQTGSGITVREKP